MIEEIKKLILMILLLSAICGASIGVSLTTNNGATCLFCLPAAVICTYIITEVFHTLDELERRLL